MKPAVKQFIVRLRSLVQSIGQSISFVAFGLFLVFILLFASLYTRARVHAAPNAELNFQARLLTSQGGIVADGNSYSVQFKLYSVASGGTAEWTETQSGLTVKAGYLSVHLGSVTPFPGTIDWSQQQWLTMNVNSDGEMTPRLQLTAVPAAFHANETDALRNGSNLLTANDLAQLGPSSPQAVSLALAALRLNQTGAGGLLQFQHNGSDVFTLANNGDLTSNGSATFSGGTLTLGSASQSGGLIVNDGAGKTATVQSATLGANRTITLPDEDGTVCLRNSTSCGFVTTGGLGAPYVNGGNSFGLNSTLGTNDNFTLSLRTNNTNQLTLDTSGNLNFLNGGLQIGGTTVLTSGRVLQNVTADTSILTSGVLGVARGGTGSGTFTSNGVLYGNGTGALQVTSAGTGGQVLLANGSGVPTFTTFSGDVTVDSSGVTTIGANTVTLGTDTVGDYVTNLGTLTGLSVSGNSGEGSTPDLSVIYGSGANTAAQGNSNLSFSGGGNLTGTVSGTAGGGFTTNTLDVVSNPTFSGLITGQANTTGLALTGTPAPGTGITSLLQLGSAISGGNTSTNGGTYIGLNAPNSGAGSAADFLNFQLNGASKLQITNAGNIITAGTLQYANGTADTNTLVCRNSSGQLAACSSGSVTGTAFVQGGNNFGGSTAGTLGTINNGVLNFITNNTTQLTLDTSGNLNLANGGLQIGGTTVITSARVAQNLTGISSSGTITFSGLNSSGVVHTNGSGVLSTSAVVLGTDTSGSYVANLGTLTGLSTTGNSGAGSTPTLTVLYGSTANTAVQGNTTLTCPSGTGNLTGGGNTITLGTGGTCNGLDTVNNPTFSGLVTLSDSGTTALALTGAPTNAATSSLVQIGSAIASGNNATNGGTYLGLNAPNSGAGSAADFINFQVNGTYKLKVDNTGLVDAVGGLAVNGSTVLTSGKALQNLTGVNSSGTITFSALGAGIVQASSGGVLSSGAVDRNSATFFSNALNVANGGTGAGTFTTNGVLYGNGTSALGVTAAGTTGQCLVATSGNAPSWGSCAGAGSGVTLQAAYANGNTITTSDGRDISFTLADTTTDGNLLVNIASGSTGKFAVQNNGSDILQVTTAGGVAITGNTSVASGTFTSSGGTISLNAGSNFATNINTGGSSGTITLGGGSAPLVIDSTHFDVSSAGALSGITSISLSGAISGGTTYSGSGNINTTGGTLQTNSTDRVDNSGNLVNIGNITGTGAVTLSSTGGANALNLTSGSGTLVLGGSTNTIQRSNSALTIDVANGSSDSTLTVTNSGSGVANLSVEGGITAAGGTYNLNVNGDQTAVSTLLDGSSTANGSSGLGSSTSLTLTSAANFDVGNYVQVTSNNCGGTGINPCYAKITAKATNTLTITPALTWANGATVKEYHIPEIGGVDTSQTLANRYGRGYFIAGVATGNGTTYYNEDSIVTSLANFDLLTGLTGNLNIGTGASQVTVGNSSGATTINGTVTFSGNTTAPSSGTAGYLSRSGTTLQPTNAGDNFTTSGNISTTGSGTITSAGALTVQGGGASITGGLTLATGALNLTSGGITNTGSIAGATTINASGLITGVGFTGGSGLIQNTGGITSTGSISLNASASTNTTNIGTGSTSGQVTIGGGSTPLVIDSTNFDVSSAGALSGITTIGLSGAITGATSGNTINGLIINSGALSGVSTINASGLITSVGHNAGTGLIQNTGGITSTGSISLNASASTNTTNIGTGTTSGQVTIGGGSTPLVIDSTNFDVSSAGALSGVTTIGLSGAISGATSGNTINGLIINSGALSGISTINASGLATTVGLTAGSGLVQGTGGLTFTGSISLNANASTNTTNIGTGSTSGQVTIGGGSTPLVIDSTNFDVSSAGALSGITTINMSGAITAATSSNTINGLIINSGALSGVTGFTQTSGNFAMSGSGTFGTGTGAISLNGDTTVAANKNFTLASGTGAFSQTFTGTGDAAAITANSLTTGAALKVTSSNNTAANTTWNGLQFNVTNAQGTTAVSTGSIYGLDLEFTQNTSVAGNTESAANIAVKQNDSSSTDATVASILNLANNDTSTGNQITVTDGLKILGANVTNGINLSGTFGTNLITSTNFTVTQAGALTAVGLNSGTGLIQGTGGLTITGATVSLNASSNFATNINTGTSSGTVTIGGGSAPLVIDSTHFDVSSAGALSGITTVTASGNINTTAGVYQVGGVSGINVTACTAAQYIGNGVTLNGGITTAGSCHADGLSDQRLKKNVTNTNDDVLSRLTELRTVNFQYRCDDPTLVNSGMDCNYTNQHTGVIAQEIGQVFPDLVFQDENGYYNVKYQELGVYTLKGLQQLDQKVSSLSDSSSSNPNPDLNSVSTGGTLRLDNSGILQNINGLTLVGGGASVAGGINNNSGGITNSGAIAGATSIDAQKLVLHATGTDDLLDLKKDDKGVFTVFNDGSLQVQQDSSHAITVKDLNGKNIFNIDTATGAITLGNGDSAKTVLFVLDNRTLPDDPPGTNGASYFNTVSGRFRCYEAGWRDCLPAGDLTDPISATQVSWHLQTADEEFPGTPRIISNLDRAHEYRLRMRITSAGAANATCRLQYAMKDNDPWKDVAQSDGELKVNQSGTLSTDWIKLVDDARKEDTIIRVVCKGSDGRGIVVYGVSMQLR